MKNKFAHSLPHILLGLSVMPFLTCLPGGLQADVFYVSDANGSNTETGTSWDKAKKTIQAGIDTSHSGDVLVVGPGTYKGTGNVNLAFGGKSLLLVARDGPAATILDGEDVASTKGFIMDQESDGHHHGQRVVGFRLIGFKAEAIYYGSAEQCQILGSYKNGYKTFFRNCLFKDMNYGGTYNKYFNCTFHNSGYYPIWNSEAIGCIVWAMGNNNNLGSQVSHSCLEKQQAGEGNFIADPKFVNAGNGDFHLQADSPCANVALGSRIGKHFYDSDHAPGYLGAFPPVGWPSGHYQNVVTAGISLGNPPSVEVVSMQQRADSDVIDLQYRLTDADSSEVEVRAVATTKYLDELDYWDDFVPVETLVDGTVSNHGAGVAPAAAVKTLSWDAGQDVGGTKRNLSLRLLASDSSGLPLSMHWITLPASGNDPAITVSKYSGAVSSSQLRQTLLWALLRGEAERDADLIAYTSEELSEANGLKLWLKGDSIDLANGQAVTAWEDSSGHENNMTGAGATLAAEGIAGEPSLYFNGSGMMWVDSLDLQLPHTVAVMSQGEVGSSGRLVSSRNKNWSFGYHSGIENRFFAGAWIVLSGDQTQSITGQPLLHVAVCDGTTATVFERGHFLGSAASTTPIGKIALGGYNTNLELGKGMVAEVIAFDRVLSPEEVQKLEGYLMEKYHYPIQDRHRNRLLFGKGGSYDGELIADEGFLTEHGVDWLADKLGTRLATGGEVSRVLEASTPETVTQWPSVVPLGTFFNEYGIETSAFDANDLPKTDEWVEDFSNDADKGKWRDWPSSAQTQLPPDGNWNITQAGTSDSYDDWYVKVTDGRLMIDNVDQEAHWESKSIDLEGEENLFLSFHLTEDGALDPDDFVKIGYKLGNDAPVMVWDQNGTFGDVTVIRPIPAHPSLKLILQAKNNGYEKIYLERVAVSIIDHTDLSEGFSSFFLIKEED